MAAALHLTAARRAGLWAGVPPGFVSGAWLVMSKPDLLHFHAREAARYRRLLANATTPAVKARLAEQAAQHERLADAQERVTGREQPTVEA